MRTDGIDFGRDDAGGNWSWQPDLPEAPFRVEITASEPVPYGWALGLDKAEAVALGIKREKVWCITSLGWTR